MDTFKEIIFASIEPLKVKLCLYSVIFIGLLMMCGALYLTYHGRSNKLQTVLFVIGSVLGFGAAIILKLL